MIRKTALKEVPVGTTFEVWNHKYTVLNKENDKIFCIATEIEDILPFRDDGTPYEIAPNDFRDSSIRNELNIDYLEMLQKDGLKNGQILDMDIDLKCTLGQHEYGKDNVKVGLLTLEEYGQYYDIIPKIDSSWWLATPWKTPSRSSSTYNTGNVWYVYSNGDCSNDYYGNTSGVRPTLTLSNSLLVTWDGEYDSSNWDDYIKYLHEWAVRYSDKSFEGDSPLCYNEWLEYDKEMQKNIKQCQRLRKYS